MPRYRIDAKTEGHEIYYVEAADLDEATEMFENETLPEPYVSEVLAAWIETIEEVTD